ncbi:hypothetical protein Hanom_Chr14g01269501 [Helianthus anomalus]
MCLSQETYNKYVVDKYGKDTILHPEIDMELLLQRVGGKKKCKMYGIGTITDLHKREVTTMRYVLTLLVEKKAYFHVIKIING